MLGSFTYGLILGVLLSMTFANLCLFCFLFLKRDGRKKTEPAREVPQEEKKESGEMLSDVERLNIQFENLLNYDGTEKGQKDV